MKNIYRFVDIVVVMTVIPGFGGQKFIKRSRSNKISLNLKDFKNKNKFNFEIEVDGGINKETG